jgi:hypothetical protein
MLIAIYEFPPPVADTSVHSSAWGQHETMIARDA